MTNLMKQGLVVLILVLVTVFLLGAACGLAAVFAGKVYRLDEWATGWIGGFASAGVLVLLTRQQSSQRRS